jgi:predicted DNA-binding transcriptional regulator AlpA
MAGLSGMKQICAYCQYSEVTILQWIRLDRFPATKIGGAWVSDTELVDDWRKKRILERYRRKVGQKKPKNNKR